MLTLLTKEFRKLLHYFFYYYVYYASYKINKAL